MSQVLKKINLNKNRFNGARYMAQHPDYLKPKAIDSLCEKFDGIDKDEIGNAVTQENLVSMMRRLVSRRFESSMPAFMNTLKSLLNSSKLILEWHDKVGVIPVYKRADIYLPNLDDIIDDDGNIIDDINDNFDLKKLRNKGGWWIEKKYLKEKFIKSLKNDIYNLQNLNDSWELYRNSRNYKDNKLNELKSIITKELAMPDKRKVVIFTEYVDTANYLYESLQPLYKNRILLFRAVETANRQKLKDLKYNFDASSDKQKDDFDILIATDTIAEGKNLHRAGTIINYDLPYNPTKVVQRIGRINRISKKMFEELHIYNFFPTQTGERATNIRALTGIKKSMFNAIYGDDTKTLSKDETLGTFLAHEQVKEEEISAETKYANMIWKIREDEPELIKKVESIPNKIFVKRNIDCKSQGLICFTEIQGQPRFRFIGNDGDLKTLTSEKYLNIFEADINEKSLEASEDSYKFNDMIDNNKIFEQKKSSRESSKNKREAVKKIEHLHQDCKTNKNHPKYIEYLSDLLYVIQELDSLPAYLIKMIAKLKIEENSVHQKDFFKKLMDIVKPYYLKSRIYKAKKIENSPETLIIREHIDVL